MKQKIWNILNKFRMKYWLTEPKAQIDIGDFDKMMDEIEKEFGK
jgi:hypothetical protein|tara:strand:+ start:3125 stop:3256 length:132 start_codon:yes stop_codon:yes gene_type:complete